MAAASTTRRKAPTPRPSRRPPGPRSPRTPRAPARGRWRLHPARAARARQECDLLGQGRGPKVDKMVLLPMPEANARTAALLSGQVDWVEAPAPDACPSSSSAASSSTPTSSRMSGRGSSRASRARPGTTSASARPRTCASIAKASRTACSRGLMVPATGTFEPGHPWRGKPTFGSSTTRRLRKRLMQEAGYRSGQEADGEDPDLGVRLGPDAAAADERISAAGAGRMLFRRELDVIEWNTLFTNWRRGAKDPSPRLECDQRHLCGHGPVLRPGALLQSGWRRRSRTIGACSATQVRRDGREARTTFEPAARDAALAKLHAAGVDEALFIWVAHDVGPRAMSPRR